MNDGFLLGTIVDALVGLDDAIDGLVEGVLDG